MLQNSPLLSTEALSARLPLAAEGLGFSAPGKVFLLGEYAVLTGLPAVVAAVGPRFQLLAERTEDLADSEARGFHPKSPAAKLLDWASSMRAPIDELQLRFEDPFEGAGGFGASTAQFALAYRAISEAERWENSWERVWRLYRELTSGAGLFAPSGADLVAQWEGGVVVFEPGAIEGPRAERIPGGLNSVLVFSATNQPGRKIATHEHLAALSIEGRLQELAHSLRAPLDAGLAALRSGSMPELGRAFTAYGDALAKAGLEIEATASDRAAFAEIPGVLGVKGAGAMQADAILVVIEENAREKVLDLAESRGLELVSDGIGSEPGVSFLHA